MISGLSFCWSSTSSCWSASWERFHNSPIARFPVKSTQISLPRQVNVWVSTVSTAASSVASIAELVASSFVKSWASLLCAIHWHTTPCVWAFACSKLGGDVCGSNHTDGNVRIDLLGPRFVKSPRRLGDNFTSSFQAYFLSVLDFGILILAECDAPLPLVPGASVSKPPLVEMWVASLYPPSRRSLPVVVPVPLLAGTPLSLSRDVSSVDLLPLRHRLSISDEPSPRIVLLAKAWCVLSIHPSIRIS